MTFFDDDLTTELRYAAAAGLAVASTLLLEHFALWPFATDEERGNELRPLLFYTIGTATIGAGISVLSVVRKRPQAAIDFWTIAGMGGAAIASVRVWRWRQRLALEAARLNGHAAGSVHGARLYATHRGDGEYR